MAQLAQYPHTISPFGSCGQARLRVPHEILWPAFKNSVFLPAVLDALTQIDRPLDVPQTLRDAQLTPQALALGEWVDGMQPQSPPLEFFPAQLLALAKSVDRLATDDRALDQDLADVDEQLTEGLTAIEDRVRQLSHRLAISHGPNTARRMVRKLIDALRRSLPSTTSRLDGAPALELKDLAAQFRQLAEECPGWFQWLARLWSGAPASWWLSADRRQAATLDYQQLQRLAAQMFETRVAVLRRRALAKLAGTTTEPGRLNGLLADLDARTGYFRELSQFFAAQTAQARPRGAHELLVVSRLDDQLASGTYAEVVMRLLRQARATPQWLADRLLRHGLTINQQRVAPARWHRLPVRAVADALQRFLDLQLEDQDPQASFYSTALRQPRDHVALLTLDHPEFRPRLRPLVRQLVDRSLPYAETRALGGVQPERHVLLFCHPAQRPALLPLIQAQGLRMIESLGGAGGGSDFTGLELTSRYAATLAQERFLIPLGAIKTTATAMAAAVVQQASGLFALPVDVCSLPEPRRLAERPVDYGAAAALFKSAAQQRVFRNLAPADQPPRYVLPTTQPALQALFDRYDLQPQPASLAQWRDLLASGQLAQLIPHVAPDDVDPRQLLARLETDPRPQSIVEHLADAGVLTGVGAGLFQLSRLPPPGPVALPAEIVVRRELLPRGLSAEACTALLQQHDLLFNQVVWALVDRALRGQTPPADLPPFVRSHYTPVVSPA